MISDWLNSLTGWQGVALAVGVAVVGHLLVRAIQAFAESILRGKGESREQFIRRYPKAASLITIGVSSFTFIVYFGAIGLLLVKAGVPLGGYLATATVLGLAVGFGSQGLVQDIVVGLTLIFSDVLDVGDMVEIAGQTGRVDRIGLRFTTIVNFHKQEIYVPNRTIASIGRYRRGYESLFVDIEIPEMMTEERVKLLAEGVASALHVQLGAIIVRKPEIVGVQRTGSPDTGGWQYLRVRFHLWPGQREAVRQQFQNRILAAIRLEVSEYQGWMISSTSRAS